MQAETIIYFRKLHKGAKKIARIQIAGLPEKENWRVFLAGGGTVNGVS